ncbi:MAG: hypothetical protein KIT09_05240 [Bryobacteraceae bacterium]|nr:hypothetical protein [Bryobacteraceae bacterium]
MNRLKGKNDLTGLFVSSIVNRVISALPMVLILTLSGPNPVAAQQPPSPEDCLSIAGMRSGVDYECGFLCKETTNCAEQCIIVTECKAGQLIDSAPIVEFELKTCNDFNCAYPDCTSCSAFDVEDKQSCRRQTSGGAMEKSTCTFDDTESSRPSCEDCTCDWAGRSCKLTEGLSTCPARADRTDCPADEGGSGGGSGGDGGVGTCAYPVIDPAVGLFTTKSGSCTAVLITPWYFVVPASCVANTPLARPASGEEWTWKNAAAVLNVNGRVAASVAYIVRLGSEGAFDLALGKLKSSIASIEPARIGIYAPRDEPVQAFGYGRSDCNREGPVASTFRWPTAPNTPIKRGSAVFAERPMPKELPLPVRPALLMISNKLNNTSWTDLTRFREKIFEVIRSIDGGFERGINRWAADLSRPGGPISTGTEYDCREECERNRSCAAFAFFDFKCYLKGAIPDPLPAAGVVSGLPRRISMLSRPGNRADVITATSQYECEAECGKRPTCRAFDYLSGGASGMCFLRPEVPDVANACSNCGGGSFREEKNYDRKGEDLRSISQVSDLHACALECAKNPECQAWTLNPKYNNWPAQPGRCWLKRRPAFPVPNNNPGFVSGLRRGIDYGVDLLLTPSRDWRSDNSLKSSTPEPEKCQAQCEKDGRCKAWVMKQVETSYGCSLFNAAPQEKDRKTGVAGVASGLKGAFKF